VEWSLCEAVDHVAGEARLDEVAHACTPQQSPSIPSNNPLKPSEGDRKGAVPSVEGILSVNLGGLPFVLCTSITIITFGIPENINIHEPLSSITGNCYQTVKIFRKVLTLIKGTMFQDFRPPFFSLFNYPWAPE